MMRTDVHFSHLNIPNAPPQKVWYETELIDYWSVLHHDSWRYIGHVFVWLDLSIILNQEVVKLGWTHEQVPTLHPQPPPIHTH